MFVWRHISLICMLIHFSRSETPPSLYPNLDIYPNTSIIFKPNTSHNISCIADKSNFDFVIRLYQINNGKYDIRANTTKDVLKTVLHLTEQDDGSSLQCFIVWKYHTKSTKTIDLMLNDIPDATPKQNEIYSEPDVSSQLTWENEGASDENPSQEKSSFFPDVSSQLSSAQAGVFGASPTQDQRYFVSDLSSQLSREYEETPPPLFPKVDIYPNTSITYKPNSNHIVSCIGHNLRYNFVIRLYQIKNGKYVIRAETTGNVLKTVLHFTEQDDGSSLQCCIMWKFNTKASKRIDVILNRASDDNPSQEKSSFFPDVSSQLSSAQAGSFWGYFDSVNATIIIIVIIIIVIFILLRTRDHAQDFLCFDSIPSYKINLMNFEKNPNSTFKTSGDYKRITEN